jgi:hypothetical protein
VAGRDGGKRRRSDARSGPIADMDRRKTLARVRDAGCDSRGQMGLEKSENGDEQSGPRSDKCGFASPKATALMLLKINYPQKIAAVGARAMS